MQNIIFNIQRFCVNDGPGIRTTVFLKGCPLNCLWCHNPESKTNKPIIMLNNSKCIGCKKCVSVCNLHEFNDKGGHFIDRQNCTACGKCVKECFGALEICGEKTSVKDIIKEVLKDKDFYLSSKGGITLSGGDPLYNIDFTLQLLKEAKKHDLNTAIETSGFARWEDILKITPYVDLFLYDFKETDNDLHKKFTGVGNELILKNLYKLNDMGKQIILRCPIIPNYNDRQEHFKKIGELASELKNITHVEIEPYHDLGISKCNAIGKPYELNDVVVATEKDILQYIKTISCYTTKQVKRA